MPLLHEVHELASFILLHVLQEAWQEVLGVTQDEPERVFPVGHDKQVFGFPAQVAQLELQDWQLFPCKYMLLLHDKHAF